MTREEHFGLTGPVQASGARVVVVDADADAVLAAVTPRTRLLALSHVLWTSGRALPVHELRERSGIPILVDGAQSVGAIPADANGLDFLTISARSGCAGPIDWCARGFRPRAAPRLPAELLLPVGPEPSGSFEPKVGAARFDPGWIPTATLAGFLTALELPPDWGFERAREQAHRCRELLEPHAELVPGDATLVAFRAEDPPALVARLVEADVAVREVPGSGLVRVSCGWWTNEDDLERLVALLR